MMDASTAIDRRIDRLVVLVAGIAARPTPEFVPPTAQEIVHEAVLLLSLVEEHVEDRAYSPRRSR